MEDSGSHVTFGHKTWLGLVVGAGLMLRLLMAWLPTEMLVQKTLPDDAFYYFAIARNVWAGRGFSVDGIAPTNGFHPLWALALLFPFAVAQGGDLPVHLGLGLAACFDTGAAWLACQIVRRATGSAWGGVLAAALYAFNPLVAMEALNGLETALGVFCLALTAFVYVSRLAGQKQVTLGDWALLGLVIGLMLLARTDSLLFAGVLGLHALWRGRRTLKSTSFGLTVAALITAMLLLPWLGWNLISFGTVVQSSAIAAPSIFRRALFEPLANGMSLAQVWWNGFWPVIYLSLLLTFRYAGLPWTALVVTAIMRRLLTVPARTDRGMRKEANVAHFQKPAQASPGLSGLFLPLIGAILSLLIHTFVRWYPRSWYYVPLAWSSAVVTAPILVGIGAGLNNISTGRRLIRAGLAALGVVLALQGIKGWHAGFYPWQRHMMTAAQWMVTQSPADAVVASFNSGLQAYYGDRPVVNLDGVVNWEAIRAGERRALLGYARQRGATHLLDYQAYLFTQFAPYLEPDFEDCLVPVATLSPEFPPYGRVVAYRIQPDCP